MCLAIEELKKEAIELGEARGEARGKAEGKVEGKAEGITVGKVNATIEHVKNLMKIMRLSALEAFTALGIPEEEREFYLSRI